MAIIEVQSLVVGDVVLSTELADAMGIEYNPEDVFVREIDEDEVNERAQEAQEAVANYNPDNDDEI